MNPQQFSLKWNGYNSYVVGAFGSFRYEEDFVDVTLCCEGRKIRAHKILLSACSPYFKEVFKENPCQHPVIIFKNVRYTDLLSLIEFMYQGEVNVLQEQLPSFLHTAELLAIRGLTDNTADMRQPVSTTSSAIAQQLLQSQILDKSATITSADSLYLTMPSSMPTLMHPPKLVQAQISTTPIITKPLIKSPPPEMPPLTKATSLAIPIVQQQQQQQQQQQPTIVKMQVHASPQQQVHQVAVQQVQLTQPSQQQSHQQTTTQVQSQTQHQTTQPTTLQEVVASVVQSPRKKKLKVEHISTPQPTSSASVGSTVTVTTASSGQTGESEVYETDTYAITASDTRTEQEHEQYEENDEQTTGGVNTLKMEIPEFISVGEPINAESYELVSENIEERDGDGDAVLESSEMDVNRIFQPSTDERKKSNILQASMDKIDLMTDEKPYKCPECRRTFCSINAMKRHRQAKHLELSSSYECAMCDARFKTKWSLSTHKSKYHRGQTVPGTSSGETRTDNATDTTKNTSPAAEKRPTIGTMLTRVKTRHLSSVDS
ncbi:protein bric-a-brac 1-like [Anopheles funestus]|uniref:protein bric-a-brac 1-like n=1 Tax=Anopheles funestus TaxID=62324 RepID=UPI0020C5EA72|nr:protein bric-a-brac 1-like [Anopheles funestus]